MEIADYRYIDSQIGKTLDRRIDIIIGGWIEINIHIDVKIKVKPSALDEKWANYAYKKKKFHRYVCAVSKYKERNLWTLHAQETIFLLDKIDCRDTPPNRQHQA